MESKNKLSNNRNNVFKLVFWILIAVGVLIVKKLPTSYNYRNIIVATYDVILLFTFFKAYSEEFFSSILSYTFIGLGITIVLGMFFAELIDLGAKSLLIYYLVLILANTAIWSYYCLKYDLKKGKIANLIITLFIGLLMAVNSFIWIIFENLNQMPFIFKEFCLPNQSIYQSHMVLWNLILFPFFTMSSVTALAIEIKEYKL